VERESSPSPDRVWISNYGAWTIEKTNQFIWLISWEGQESWDARENAYYSSSIRIAMEPDPARLIARQENFDVENVL